MFAELKEKEKNILAYLQKRPDSTQQELAEAISLTLSTIKYYTKRLQEKGYLERRGTHRSGEWHVIIK